MLTAIIVLWGCLEDPTQDSNPEEDPNVFLIDAPADFDWACIKGTGITVNIKNSGQITSALDSTLVELYDDQNVLLDALTIYEGIAEFNVRIPTSVEQLTLKVLATGESVQINPDALTIDYVVPDVSALSFVKNDLDGDGLFDDFDVSPTNPDVSVLVGSSSVIDNLKSAQGRNTSTSSYVIFEDLWPSKGDYDFNDLVAKTTFSWTRGKGNYIEEINVVCNVEWIGAGLELGLGFELFEAKGTNLYYLGDVIADIQGAENDDAVRNGVIAFSRVQDVGTSEIEFNITLREKQFKEFVFVPYLFRTNDPGHQVRPFGAPPTQSQDLSMFRSYDDASPNSWSWEEGKKFSYPLKGNEAFYRTREIYPWGIEFISSKKFQPCKESINILNEYPTFKDWAESGGKNAKDWYDHHL